MVALPDGQQQATGGGDSPCPLSWGWYLKVVASSGLILGLVVGALMAVGESPRAEIGATWPRLSEYFWLSVGQFVALCGLGLYVGSYLTLRRQMRGSLGKPSSLVSRGFPWGRIRHPMYLADMIWLLGFSLMAGWPWSLGLWGLVVVGVWVQLNVEEVHMAAQFPEGHAEWKTRSGRLLPWVGW